MRERRQVPRYHCELKGQIVSADSLAGPDVKITTLSVRGACIEGASALKRGQKCDLKVEWSAKSLRAETEVIWADDRGRAGLRFLAMNEETKASLRDLCSTLKLAPIQAPEAPHAKPKVRVE